MRNNSFDNVPESIVGRLASYHRCLKNAASNGQTVIKSSDISKLCGIKATVVRKDLTHFGEFGIKGKGYNIITLSSNIEEIMGLNTEKKVILIGAGNLGTALLKYPGFSGANFKFLAAFDIGAEIIGTSINSVPILHIDKLGAFLKSNEVQIAILTVPSQEAETIASQLHNCSIKGILNFTSAILKSDDGKFYIRNIDLSKELEVISFCMKKCLKNKEEK
ncbi:redox-sensing transcriptional repressor Rex [Candidatus Calescamantes bacterium]|nr:redox-sensing transcriptional repressor Rex [Candidatus Calescamantes bacterium]